VKKSRTYFKILAKFQPTKKWVKLCQNALFQKTFFRKLNFWSISSAKSKFEVSIINSGSKNVKHITTLFWDSGIILRFSAKIIWVKLCRNAFLEKYVLRKIHFWSRSFRKLMFGVLQIKIGSETFTTFFLIFWDFFDIQELFRDPQPIKNGSNFVKTHFFKKIIFEYLMSDPHLPQNRNLKSQ